ncbi:group 1 truncated hemoglobin [Aliidiomarina minuta]|uniref:Group 1 truncated hemoglobin n=1 Tax=Aliidiomarina minuta TaxID=880057 RepID=A0A432W5P7_9GAMM|nr:group 1 truncated hemoglobin [Aliidiomarina minuta]RUO25299.1 group 1 truncated hemoglobin [Aliidiomarina minuta]
MKLLTALALLFALSISVPAQADDSLYQDLGERQGIEQLMQDMLLFIADDRRIAHHFRDTDIAELHQQLSDQLCDITGGPCVYEGEEMLESHKGLEISRADFNALVESLQLAFDENGTPVSAQNRLLALLAEMHGDIVNR